MSTPVELKITKVGIESIFSAENQGISLELDRVAYSSDNFESVVMDERTSLGNIVYESSIAVGGVSEDKKTLRFFSILNVSTETQIRSLGVYTKDNVLFAIASVPSGNLFKVYNGVSFIASFGLAISPTLSSMVQVVTDRDAAMSLILMGDHEGASNPHPQYQQAINLLKKQIEDANVLIDQLKKNVIDLQGGLGESINAGSFKYLTKKTNVNTLYPLQYRAHGRPSGWDIRYHVLRVSVLILPNGYIKQTLLVHGYGMDLTTHIYLPVYMPVDNIFKVTGQMHSDVEAHDAVARLRAMYEQDNAGKRHTVIAIMFDQAGNSSKYHGASNMYIEIEGNYSPNMTLTSLDNFPLSDVNV